MSGGIDHRGDGDAAYGVGHGIWVKTCWTNSDLSERAVQNTFGACCRDQYFFQAGQPLWASGAACRNQVFGMPIRSSGLPEEAEKPANANCLQNCSALLE